MKAQAVNFFGCLYDANGVHPDPGKVDAVHALLAPTNVTKLQEFLGLVMYLSPFIPGLSTLTAPLHELLKKDTDFTWNCTYDATFQHIIEAVVSNTTLRYFDPSLLMTIQVDASHVGLGVAHLQHMLLHLQGYNYTIHYHPSKEMALPDTLSWFSPHPGPDIPLDIAIYHAHLSP